MTTRANRFSRFPCTRLAVCLLLGATVGCEGLPKLSRFLPEKDHTQVDLTRFGPTPLQRIEELKDISRKLPQMPQAQRQQTSDILAKHFYAEQDPLVRLEIIRTLAPLSTTSAAGVLRDSLSDRDPGVRITSCRLWSARGGREAVTLLAARLSSDTDKDVRMAAARGLGELPGPQAAEALAAVLQDKDVALQYRAM